MILYRHVIREHILPFIYSLAVIIFIFIMQLAVDLIHKILSKGLDFGTIAEIFLLNLGWMIALAIPMAILIATLTAFGKMSADSEILAIKAAGFNIFYLITPVIAGASVIAVLLVFFNNLILPEANHKSTSLMSDISRKKPAALIEPKVLIKDFKNYAIWVKEVDSKTGKLTDVRIFTDIPGKSPSTTIASTGEIHTTQDQKYLKLVLYNGETHTSNKSDGVEDNYFVGRFEKQTVYIENVDSRLKRTNNHYRGDREKSSAMMLEDIAKFKEQKKTYLKSYNSEIEKLSQSIGKLDSLKNLYGSKSVKSMDSAKTFSAWLGSLKKQTKFTNIEISSQKRRLKRVLRRIHQQNLRISQYMVEVHKKFSIPFTCIVFVLIGAPLGIMTKRGGIVVGASYSVFFFIVFWAFLIGGESLADRLIINPFTAMWAGNFLIGISGIYLISRMLRETTFISFDPLIQKWFNIVNNKHLHKVSRKITGISRVVFGLPSLILDKIAGILSSYLIKIFIGWIFGVFGALSVVFIVVDYISNLKLFEAASFLDILHYYYYYLPWFFQLLSPMGILLAAMFAMGSLAKNSELTAMKASGISINRLTFPLLIIGIGLFAVTFYYGETVVPVANSNRLELKDKLRDQRRVKNGGVPRQKISFRRNFYYFGNDDMVYCFQEFRTHPQKSKNVWRETFFNAKIIERVQAEKFVYENGKWFFVNGHKLIIHGEDSISTQDFDTLYDKNLNSTPEEMVTRIKSVEEMSYWELKDAIKKAVQRGENATKYQADLHFKIALPFMNFIVILLGISVTARAGKKGAGSVFGIGLLIVFAYWIISQFGLALGQDERIKPIMAAWAGNILFFVIGAILYARTSK